MNSKLLGKLSKKIVSDVGLSLYAGAIGNLVDNLMGITDQPSTFQKVSLNGKPGFCLRVGQIQTERFTGQGLHVFTHSGSEGFLDTLEFEQKLQISLKRHGVIFQNRS